MPTATRVVPHLSFHGAMTTNLELVVGALERAGIPYFFVPISARTYYRVGVKHGSEAAVYRALQEAGDDALRLVFRTGTGRFRTVSPTRTRSLPRAAPGAGSWLAYVPLADPEGKLVLGQEHACEIEFWQTSAEAPGRLRAVRRNSRTLETGEDVIGAGSVEIAGRIYATFPQYADLPHLDDVTFPVDLVYTWVDDRDPAWRERKAAVLREVDPSAYADDAADESRFESHDELRYSFRSVAMAADFVRHIYLVTDDQVPAWLDTGHPKVTVVSHKEIFGDRGKLPTFNSHAIETQLHHIEGLSEHYIYMNDDVFFGRRVTPIRFFESNGMSRSFPSTAVIEPADAEELTHAVDHAARRNQQLILERFGRLVTEKFKHAPHPQQRSVMFELERTFPEAFEVTASSQFRSRDDIAPASSLHHHYAYVTGAAVPSPIGNRYVWLAAPDFRERMAAISAERDFETLCVNDGLVPPEVRQERTAALGRFLDDLWPTRCEFER